MDYKGLDSWDDSHTSKGSYLKIEAVASEKLGSATTATFEAVKGNSAGSGKFTGNANWKSQTLEFSVSTQSDVTLNIIHHLVGGVRTDVAIDNLKLSFVPFATAEDYNALSTAITAVENKAWGFDVNEYAPYNYVKVLEALATAKAIDQKENNTQKTIQDLTATLNGATWTANTEELNAFYDGTFSDAQTVTGNTCPKGWHGSDSHYTEGYWVRLMYSDGSSNTGLAHFSNSCAMMAKSTPRYGLDPGYTLPLNANTYYKLSFDFAGWGGENAGLKTTIVITDESNNRITVNPAQTEGQNENGQSNVGAWKTYSGIFKTSDAGNYKLLLNKTEGDGSKYQITYGDMVLKTLTVAEATDYYNSVKTSVEEDYDADANGGNEKTAFKEALDADVSEYTVAQLMEAAANLPTLRDAFVAATPKYDLYLAEKANAERISSTITSSITAPTTAAEAETAFHDILVGEYNYVKNNFNADAAVKYGMTIDQWTGTATSGGNADTPQTNSNEKWGDAATTYYEQGANGWGSSAWTLNYTITKNLPAGTYVLKIAARASVGTTATLKATFGETTITESLPNYGAEGKGITTVGVASFNEGEFAKDGKGYGWQWRYLAVTLSEASNVTFQIDASANTKEQWCSFGDVAVISNVNLTALTTSYNNFTMKTLGFQKDEYAPYTNAALLQAYADAKAIVENTAEPEDQAQVNALTTTLTAAEWVQNADDMDAIFNGTFAETGTGSNPKGWTRNNNGWGQQITGLTADANGVNEGTTTAWYYNNNGAWQYGNDGVYTMPLAANQAYELTFKYRKHGSDWQNWMKASVLNSSDEGLEVAQFSGAADGTNFVTAKAYFKTGAAGNYLLSIEQNGNAHLTDVSLVKAESAELALNEGTTYEPVDRTYYETVMMTRKVVAGYNTVCLPFGLTNEQMEAAFGTSAEVYAYSETSEDATNATINFNKVDAGTITANVPVLVKATAASTSQTFEGVQIVAATDTKVEGTNFDFIGTYAPITVAEGDYFIGNGALYKSKGATSMKAFRAYIRTKNSEAKVNLFIDGVSTSISEINGASKDENAAIYNIAGQRVNKAQKGIYIVNGKKVLVK